MHQENQISWTSSDSCEICPFQKAVASYPLLKDEVGSQRFGVWRINRQRKIRRQVLVSTHSEEILSDPGIGGEEVLRLEPSPDGTLFRSPLEQMDELELLRTGLTVADVVLPKSAPANANQLELCFP
jgi:hypothetical protein